MKKALMTITAILLAFPAAAQDSAISAEQENTAREIGRSLRCVVCQNQSIEDSDADLAKDMRGLVRERLAAGDEPDEVIEFIRARYGDYVLLKPPVQGNTWLLWALPFILLIGGSAYLARRRPSAPKIEALTDAEEQALESLRKSLEGDQEP